MFVAFDIAYVENSEQSWALLRAMTFGVSTLHDKKAVIEDCSRIQRHCCTMQQPNGRVAPPALSYAKILFGRNAALEECED